MKKLKFQKQNLIISEDLAKKICIEVENYSSYVQQLAWNVMLNTNHEVTEEIIEKAIINKTNPKINNPISKVATCLEVWKHIRTCA